MTHVQLTSANTSAELRAAVVHLTNEARGNRKPLKMSRRLTLAAQKHATDMAEKDYFSHESEDGRSWIQRIKAEGFQHPGGENIAYGQQTAREVVDAWMDSPGHRRNILDPEFRYIGIGFSRDGDYWVQDFGY